MTTRDRVIEIARGQAGHRGSEKYWLGVNGSHPGDGYHWCGVWALWCLRQAGLTDAKWVMGRGFVGPLGLPQTLSPQPGDIGYIHSPYQHHCIVEHADSSTVRSVDGNSPGDVVALRERPRAAFTAFYSIQPLLERTAPQSAPVDAGPRIPDIRLAAPYLRGPDVRSWQTKLKDAGIYEGAIDGVCGPMTVKALLVAAITWTGDDGHG